MLLLLLGNEGNVPLIDDDLALTLKTDGVHSCYFSFDFFKTIVTVEDQCCKS